MIRLELLGSLDLRDANGRELHSVLAQPKRTALLACLALSGTGYQRRDQLLAMFWPESDAERARKALRQAIFFLRRSLGQDTILSRGDDEVALNAERVSCDVTEFEERLDRDDLAGAVELYRGPLLPGFHVDGVPEFDYLIDTRRARLHRQAVEAGDRLIDRLIEQGRRDEALQRARWCAEMAPADAGPVGRLLRLLEEDGDRTAALRAYDEYTERLAREYDLEPHPELRSIVERIREISSGPAIRSVPAPSVVSADVETDPVGSASVGEAGSSSQTGSPPWRNRSWRWVVAGAVVIAAAAGGVRAANRLLDRPAPLPDATVAADAVEVAVAVLPFHVDGDRGISSEGFVDLISPNLEGIEGVRKVDPTTVIYAWNVVVGGDDDRITADEARAIASRIDADYVITGSAVPAGDDVVLTAQVLARDRTRALGSVQVHGPADSVAPGLTTQLTLALLREGLIPAGAGRDTVNLHGVMTDSLNALKAYLDGQKKYRKAMYEEAAQDYLQAVEVDPQFAHAWARLAQAYRWTIGAPPWQEPAERALGLVGRLPEREAILLRASSGYTTDRIPIMEAFTKRYPDDVEGLVMLGDLEWHVGGAMLHSVSDFERPFDEAVKLSPYYAESFHHLIDQAFLELDSARARELIAGYEAIGARDVCSYQVGFDLVWGDRAARARAMAVLDTVSTEAAISDCTMAPLAAPPAALDRLAAVYEKSLDLLDADPLSLQWALWHYLMVRVPRGRIADARVMLDRVNDRIPAIRVYGARWDLMLHLSIQRDTAAARRARAVLEVDPDMTDRFWLGALAIAEERWRDVDPIRTALENVAAGLRVADPEEADFAQAYADVLDAYGALMRGDSARIVDFEDALGRMPQHIGLNRYQAPMYLRYEVGSLLVDEWGDYERAERYFRSFRNSDFFYTSQAQLYLGRMAEALGRQDDAAVHYERFLAWWEDADPALQPLVDETRQALARLNDSQGGRSEPPS
jgi:DNA-binding SARP family transcriptional activator/TolB-like protein